MSELYALSEEHVALRDMVRRLAAERIAPRAAEIDRTGEFPWDVKGALAEVGLLGLHIPEEYGGSGGDALAFAVMVEEIARVCASSSVIPLVQKLGSVPLLIAASETQKKEWFPRIASGEDLISYCISEADAGSDPASMKTAARRDGDTYVLNGTKVWISMAGPSSLYTVLAKTDPDAGARGVSAFLVRKDDSGFAVGKGERKLGIRGSPTCQVHLDDCRIPADRLIGEEGKGFYYAMQAFDHTRLVVGAQAVGIAQGAIDAASAYVREREQFGRPIGEFQALQHRAAHLYAELEIARAATLKAQQLLDEGAAEAAAMVCVAKAKAGRASQLAVQEGVQMHGGIGMTDEHDIGLYMKRDRVLNELFGDPSYQADRLARTMGY
jgi:alkylation response protein AidB-like acyl-CoA dehydrogenase